MPRAVCYCYFIILIFRLILRFRELPQSMDLLILSSKPIETPISRKQLNNSTWTLAMVIPQQDIENGPARRERRRDMGSVQVKTLGRNYLSLFQEQQKSIALGPQSIDPVNNKAAKSPPNDDQTITAHCMILESMSSSWREFFSLHELRTSVPLVDEVLAAEPRFIDLPSTPPTKPQDASVQAVDVDGSSNNNDNNGTLQFVYDPDAYPGVTEGFVRRLSMSCNASQLFAVSTALCRPTSFTLIQGPPGTGKTSTIIALLNALHIREFNRYYAALLSAVLGPQGMSCRVRGSTDPAPWIALVSSLASSKPRILVTAPSNVAVDNIVERILRDRFLDSSGRRYKPGIIRFGGGKGASVKSVSLEELQEQEQMTYATDQARRQALSHVSDQIASIVKDIISLQSFLFNLRAAFQAHPLPQGFELRVASDTGLPYWVDHETKTVHQQPPILDNCNSRPKSELSVETLPEYRSYSQTLTHLLDQLHRCHLRRSRCQARIRPGDLGGLAGVRQAVELSLVESSEILFTTMNSAGHPSLESLQFVVAVVDEAAQSSEPSLLIPLRKGCKQCVLVGDPYQLPPTIFSDRAKTRGYGRSLFERLLDTGHPKVLLNTQYRMLPELSAFPCATFYAGQIKDGSNVVNPGYCPTYIASVGKTKDGMKGKDNLLPPLAFIDLESSQDLESQESLSRWNEEEAQVCVALLRLLASEVTQSAQYCIEGKYSDTMANNSIAGPTARSDTSSRSNLTNSVSVGVISPYSAQVSELRRLLKIEGLFPPDVVTTCNVSTPKPASTKSTSTKSTLIIKNSCCVRQNDSVRATLPINVLDVEVNTVDGFQGKEKDVIIISCVRASDEEGVGFLADYRRLNVALTRARFALYVIGHAPTLKQNDIWRSFLLHTERNHANIALSTSHTDLRHAFLLLRTSPPITSSIRVISENQIKSREIIDENLCGLKRHRGHNNVEMLPPLPSSKLRRPNGLNMTATTEGGYCNEDSASDDPCFSPIVQSPHHIYDINTSASAGLSTINSPSLLRRVIAKPDILSSNSKCVELEDGEELE